MEQLWFALPPGDRRQAVLCALLERDGHSVQLMSAPERWDQENLPPPGTIVPVANATSALRERADKMGLRLLEYGKRADFMAENGAITAENALRTAMEQGIILHGKRALVIGWGNIGKPLCMMLRGIGMTVTASARKTRHLSEIEAMSYLPVHTAAMEGALELQDLVFNTVPAMVLGEKQLALLPKHAVVIDLASAPGGVDLDAARELSIRALPALALPGKMTPQPAAEAILHAVYHAIEEGF